MCLEKEIVLKKYFEQKYFTQVNYLTSNEFGVIERQSYYPNDSSDNSFVCDPDPIFDVASLTKVFVGAYLTVIALQEQRLKIDDEIVPKVTVEMLLNHTSGIISWLPLYLMKKDIAISKMKNVDLSHYGKRVYSDIGLMLLGQKIEEIYNENLMSLWKKKIFTPLKLQSCGFRTMLSNPNEMFVPTSFDNPYEKKLALNSGEELKEHFVWRNYRIQGECNDGNCHFYWGGVSAHAGLFSSINDMAILIKSFWNQNFFDQYWAKKYLGFTPGNVMDLGLNQTFGHHGFTGCSFALDPETKKFMVFLSNRQWHGLGVDGNYPAWKNCVRELIKDFF